MIRERPKTTGDKKSVEKSVDGSVVELPPTTSEQLRTFQEQAIKVLNILDSNGIDIYDPKRTPGMYLHQRGISSQNLNQSTIGKILHKSNDSDSPVSSTSETSTAPSSLIEFLSKRK